MREVFELADRGGSAAEDRFAAARCYMTPPGPATPRLSWFDPRLVVAPRRGARQRRGPRRGAVHRGRRAAAGAAPLSARRLDRALMRPTATCGAAASLTRSFVEWHLLYLMQPRRSAGTDADRGLLPAHRPLQLQRRSADRADSRASARWPRACARAPLPLMRLDRDRPLPAPLSRRRRLSRRSERTQRAAERWPGGVAGGFRSRQAAPPGLVVRQQSGAAAPLDREDHRCAAAGALLRGRLGLAAERLFRRLRSRAQSA